MVLAALLLPRAPAASAHIEQLSISASGTISPGNSFVTVSGQIQCSAGESWELTSGTLAQVKGPTQVRSDTEGDGFASCNDGSPQT
jgi:hypothetical protein